jgi:rubrerythrin
MSEFLKICPACGYSFKSFDPRKQKKIKKCPMCGYKLMEPSIFPEDRKEFDDTLI